MSWDWWRAGHVTTILSCDWSRFCGSYKYDVTTRGYKKTDKYSGRPPDLFILTSLLQVECTNCDIHSIFTIF